MKTILSCFFMLILSIVTAQPGTLDPTFGNAGIAKTTFRPGNFGGVLMAVQNDGKIVVASWILQNGSRDFALSRFNADGSPDKDFEEGETIDGMVTTDFGSGDDIPTGMMIQKDGKIVVAGFNNLLGRVAIARYQLNGQLDRTFNLTGKVIINSPGYLLRTLTEQKDGKILGAGYVFFPTAVVIVRLNIDGTPDPTFNGGKVHTTLDNPASASDIDVQNDGKIIVAGSVSTSSGNAIIVGRYLQNGSIDSSFDADGFVSTQLGNFGGAQSLVIQPDNKILVTGGNNSPFPPNVGFVTARYNTNGTLDAGFDNDGVVTTVFTPPSSNSADYGQKIALQSDGKIIVSGYRGDLRGITLVRYNVDGKLDPSFGFGGSIAHVGVANLPALELYSTRIFSAGLISDTISILAFRNDALPQGCLSDQTGPYITTKNATISLDASGRATISAADVIQSITDACGVNNATLTISPNTFTCANLSAPGSGHQAYTSNTSQGNQNFNGELGLDFRVNAPGITIGQLGAFDHQGNGITGTQNGGIRVAIFNKSTRTIVPGLDVIVSGNGDSYSSNFRFKNVSPVVLPPGEYVVVAKGYYEKELNGNLLFGPTTFPLGDAGGGAITFLTTPIYGENLIPGFSYPTKSFGSGFSNLFLAGSFTYQTSSARPEFQAYVSNTATGNQNFYGELGSDFRVNDASGIIINRLGAFDHQGNGIAGSQNGGVRVAVFNRATRSIVPGLDVVIAGLGDYYESFYRFKYITPVTLMPGDYVLVAKGYRDTELNGNFQNAGTPYPTGENGANAITFLNTTYWGQNTFSGFSYPVFAANLGTTSPFLAGTFVYSKTTASVNNMVAITVRDNNGSLATATATVLVSDPLQACLAQTTAAPGLVENTAENRLITSNRNSSIKVFPNPSNDVITVELFDLKVPKVDIQIINSSGVVVDQQSVKLSGKTASLTTRFNLSRQPAGVYLMKVVFNTNVETRTVLLQR